MASAKDLYSALYTNLFGQEAGKSVSLAHLNRHFRQTEELTVLILDEMDVLLTKKSTELYNLFEWCWEGGRLCILGISNTVNLPKRLPAPVQKSIPRGSRSHSCTDHSVLGVWEQTHSLSSPIPSNRWSGLYAIAWAIPMSSMTWPFNVPQLKCDILSWIERISVTSGLACERRRAPLSAASSIDDRHLPAFLHRRQ